MISFLVWLAKKWKQSPKGGCFCFSITWVDCEARSKNACVLAEMPPKRLLLQVIKSCPRNQLVRPKNISHRKPEIFSGFLRFSRFFKIRKIVKIKRYHLPKTTDRRDLNYRPPLFDTIFRDFWAKKGRKTKQSIVKSLCLVKQIQKKLIGANFYRLFL